MRHSGRKYKIVHVSHIVNVCTYRSSSSSSAFIGHIQQFEYSAKGGGSREKERKKERGREGKRERERERERERRKIGIGRGRARQGG